jgi:hypothetical protein
VFKNEFRGGLIISETTVRVGLPVSDVVVMQALEINLAVKRPILYRFEAAFFGNLLDFLREFTENLPVSF